MTDFAEWFKAHTGNEPHPWQRELGEDDLFRRRLIRIPTGFGKTLGVLLAWVYHRVHRGDERWPRRLVWCLPMRVLVEQTTAVARQSLHELGLLWKSGTDPASKVGVHLLMGGSPADSLEGAPRLDWHLYPETCAVLIGTQDMLLSRALNRGYAAGRGRWPIDFGLLNHDCLWVLDEVQLMDVGLATSAQLEAFRTAAPKVRPTGSFWMSATLQPEWLATRDTRELLADLPTLTIRPEQRTGPLWTVEKPCSVLSDCAKESALAKRVLEEHERRASGAEPTLVVVNTVDRAVKVAAELQKLIKKRGTEVRLVHSRFRGAERGTFREVFLNADACRRGDDRIIVATQVIEAGVDISASALFTDLAPWPSLVQRFGRAARWGGKANVFVVDTAPKDDKGALPYKKDELDGARDALAGLDDVAPASLEPFEERLDAATRASLYPYEPPTLLLQDDVDDLFDTSPDLTGSDLDVSRFIRSGEERDVHVFWDAIPEAGPPDSKRRPHRDALCPVPFLKARKWLFGDGRVPKVKRSAWVWSFADGAWRLAEARDLYPGQTVLVDRTLGGYDWDPSAGRGAGWSTEAREAVGIIGVVAASVEDEADSTLGDDALSVDAFRTIGTHGEDAGGLAAEIADRLCPDRAALLRLAGRLHDVGKAHPAFQGSIVATSDTPRPGRHDLAKAPDSAWLRGRALYPMPDGKRRMGFRHELASTLAMFALVRRHAPDHPALLGRWAPLLSALGTPTSLPPSASSAPTGIERAVLALGAEDFDLVAYLVASHHGKVRGALHATREDQVVTLESGRTTLRGVRDGDELPDILFGPAPDDRLPGTTMDLSIASMGLSATAGASWTDRVLGLLGRVGPFQLAWLEALLRAADVRASRFMTAPDPLLGGDVS